MKKKYSASIFLAVSVALTVIAGLALVNNVSAVVRWWKLFYSHGGDATLIPDTCPGVLPWMDWSAVDYSCATTLIPFMGFVLITFGLIRVLIGRKQNPEVFPFFKGYDQLNIAFGLIGTLWGIIIIGYFKMETIAMSDLMMCLHTALFSTLMAVVWVFVCDHAILRPLLIRVLHQVQGCEHEDEDVLEVLDQLTASAAGLCDVWKGNRDELAMFNDSVSLASAELNAFGGVGKSISELFTQELRGAAQSFIEELKVGTKAFAERQEQIEQVTVAWQARLEEATTKWQVQFEGSMTERQKQLEIITQAWQSQFEKAMTERQTHFESIATEWQGRLNENCARMDALHETVLRLVSGIQSSQAVFVDATEKIAADNISLKTEAKQARAATDKLRTDLAQEQGAHAGCQKQLDVLLKRVEAEEVASQERMAKLRAEIDCAVSEKVKLEGDCQRVQQESDAQRTRAERAESLLSKIKSAFNVD